MFYGTQATPPRANTPREDVETGHHAPNHTGGASAAGRAFADAYRPQAPSDQAHAERPGASTNPYAHAFRTAGKPAAPERGDAASRAEAGEAGANGPVSRRLFTRNMSRFTMAGGAIGLVGAAIVTGIYGGVQQAHLDGAYFNCPGLTPIGCATDTLAYSKAAVAGIMIALPIAGAAIGASIKAARFFTGRNDAETSQPVPSTRAPFFTKALARHAAIGAGVGVIAGGIVAGAVAGSYSQHIGNLYAACNYQSANFSGEPAHCDGSSDDDVHSTNQTFPVVDAVIGALAMPFVGAAMGVLQRALKHDWRNPVAQAQ